MNDFQQQLYKNLMSLTEKNEAFYFQDFLLDDKVYRIFNYRLASYTDFLQPGALECRGIMFEMFGAPQSCPRRLAAMPMEKFFNLNENPSTMNLDLSKVVRIESKADGSLMSSYLHNDEVRLKSKGSLFSEQALDAMKWLNLPENELLRDVIGTMTKMNCTVNLEWCAPQNRIVIGYEKPHLKILNVRDNNNGDYIDIDDTWWAPLYRIEKVIVDDPAQFVASVPSMTDIEGYVIQLESGQRVKLKCDWYLSLHHAKDSVNNPRRLFEAILDEGIDDLRSLFHEDCVAMGIIDQMQVKVDHVYNAMVNAVEAFYEAHKDEDRKTYAIAGQQDPSLKSGSLSFFGLAMNKYLQKPIDYKDFLKGKWKELGLRDTSLDKVAE